MTFCSKLYAYLNIFQPKHSYATHFCSQESQSDLQIRSFSIGFHRNPTFFIKNRSDPTEFFSDSFQSDSDANFVGIRRNPMKSGSDLVGFQSCSVEFRQKPGRNPTERNPTKTLSDPIEIISIRRDPIPPQSHGLMN
jgi:hypothetical protein